MSDPTPFVFATNGRRFATTPVAVQAIIVNPERQILLLNSPTRQQGWQVISGALEAKEPLLDGTLREVAEEIGTAVAVRPLGLVHAETFSYDDQVPFMLSTYYLFAYEGGQIVPGDDMIGSDFRWWHLTDLQATDLHLHASTKLWLLERALTLFELWRDEAQRPLQPKIN